MDLRAGRDAGKFLVHLPRKEPRSTGSLVIILTELTWLISPCALEFTVFTAWVSDYS